MGEIRVQFYHCPKHSVIKEAKSDSNGYRLWKGIFISVILCLTAYMTCQRQEDVSVQARCVWSGWTLFKEEIFKMLCAYQVRQVQASIKIYHHMELLADWNTLLDVFFSRRRSSKPGKLQGLSQGRETSLWHWEVFKMDMYIKGMYIPATKPSSGYYYFTFSYSRNNANTT